MSDLLTIGSSGVAAYQRALATVSNNIANVSTDGYTRQDVAIASNIPTEAGGSYIGTGARFDVVQRQYDAFIESNLRKSNSDLQAQEPLLSYVNRLIDIMGNQSTGLTSAMNLFFESSRTLASDPASTISRSTFLQDADGLAARFRQLGAQFNLLDDETRQSVETDVGQINALTQQLALLNNQLTKNSSVEKQPSELLDQRDLLLRKLSDLIAIKTKFSENGSVLVSVGDTRDQGILVANNSATELIVQNNSSGALQINYRFPPVNSATGEKQALPPLSSGKLGGALTFREQVLTPAMDALDNLAKTTAEEINSIHRSGIDAERQLGGDLFGFTAGQDAHASGMTLLIRDASRVAAAGQFRVIDDPLNPGTAQARVHYAPPEYSGPASLAGNLQLARSPQTSSVELAMPESQGYVSLGLVQTGTRDLVLTLNQATSNQSLQIFTRDGRHLLGTDLNGTSANPSAKGTAILSSIMKTANGMETGAQYSEALLHPTSASQRYLGMDLFMGAKASVQFIQQYNNSTGAALDPTPTPAVLQGRMFSGTSWQNAIRSGAFTLNGITLSPPDSAVATPDALAQWITNQHIDGISASIHDGGLQLISTDTSTDIRLGLSTTGTPGDLTALGFDTSVYVSGTAQDDLLVFATDTSTDTLQPGTVEVTAQFEDISGDSKQMLRNQSLEITFTGDENYQIRDTNTNTVLAQRKLDTSVSPPTIHYRGLSLEFSNTPQEGDVFRIDGNRDGIGNNEAMLMLSDLESSKVMPGGLTMTEAYIERVNQVANVAKQATISRQALTVVHEQAQKARDGISGVSLDEEASELVRFQQAYQANAKVMQVANQLFESILQVR